MDHDIGLQQAILASLKSAPPPAPRPRPQQQQQSQFSSFQSRPQPTITRTTTTTSTTSIPSSSSFNNNNNNHNYRRPPAGVSSSSSFSSPTTSTSFSFGSPSVSLPNGRRNTLQRQGIAPTVTSSSTSTSISASAGVQQPRTPRTHSTPTGTTNKKGPTTRGGMSGKEQQQESYSMMTMGAEEENDDDGEKRYRSNASTNITSATSEIASAYSHLGPAFANAGNSAMLSTPPPRPTTTTSSNATTASQQLQIQKPRTIGDVSANMWKELTPCLEAGSKIQRQNPSGSHLVFDSANSDSLQSLERVVSSSSSSSTSLKLYPSDFAGMVTADSITKVTQGAVASQASGAIFQFSVKPMSKICSVFVGFLPTSSSSSVTSSSIPLIEMNFTSTSSSGGSTMCSASEFSISDDFSTLTRMKQVERPCSLRTSGPSSESTTPTTTTTGPRYARAKNQPQQTDWNLLPISVTITNSSLQLDVNGETVIKNVAINSSSSSSSSSFAAAHSRIFFAVSGRCTVKNIQIGDVADIRKQQLAQSVTAASNPMVAMIESEILDRNPNVQWSDVAALDEAKRILNEAIVLPMIIPEFFATIAPPKGVLLFGPPGGGKTLLAKAVASCTKTTFFNISAASIMGKFVGESEKMVRTLFQVARRDAPSTIFFDEIDSVMTKRGGPSEHEASRRMKTELLQQMDGMISNNAGDPSQNVIVIATVNAPWLLDDAVIRRLEKRIYIPLPNATARLELFKINFRKARTNFNVDEIMMMMKAQLAEITKQMDDAEDRKQEKLFEKMRRTGGGGGGTASSKPKDDDNDNGDPETTSTSKDESIIYSLDQDPLFQSITDSSANKSSVIILAQILKLVEATHGYSGADISTVMKDASMFPLRRLIGGKSPQEIFEMKQRGELMGADGQPPPMLVEDVFEALKKVKPSVNQSDLLKFVEWGREFGSV